MICLVNCKECNKRSSPTHAECECDALVVAARKEPPRMMMRQVGAESARATLTCTVMSRNFPFTNQIPPTLSQSSGNGRDEHGRRVVSWLGC